MPKGVTNRDFIKGDSRDIYGRLRELEDKIAKLERNLLIHAQGAGTDGATEQGYILVKDTDGVDGYIRIYAAR